ncbi:response regulator, partial [Acinetobacter bereziniae]|nr:response regulator [Acinetobacter bereziniae]MBJ8456499.1 response regulator [Acinetobacter bereziniae]
MPRAILYLSQTFKDNISAFFLIAVIIFACALAGILGRPLSFLAIFWPANAVLLGLFLRFTTLKNIGGWLGAFSGFMLADLITGNSFLVTLFLTLANLSHALVTLLLIHFFKLDYKQ